MSHTLYILPGQTIMQRPLEGQLFMRGRLGLAVFVNWRKSLEVLKSWIKIKIFFEPNCSSCSTGHFWEVPFYAKFLLYYLLSYWPVTAIWTSDPYGTAYGKCPCREFSRILKYFIGSLMNEGNTFVFVCFLVPPHSRTELGKQQACQVFYTQSSQQLANLESST